MEAEVAFLQYIIENVVSQPEQLRIERTQDELWILLTLSVAKEDMWTVIWKWGNTINAIRSILRLFGMKHGKKVNLKVLD